MYYVRSSNHNKFYSVPQIGFSTQICMGLIEVKLNHYKIEIH